MAETFPYPAAVEARMKALYQSLRENDRRRYAAIEAEKLGHGGTQYIADLLGCDPKTIRRGQADLDELQQQPEVSPEPRVRRPGGGRKPATEADPNLESNFQRVLQDHTAGSPMRADLIWTDLSVPEIREALAEHDSYVCENTVRALLERFDYHRRQMAKYLDMGQHQDRNAQFENIARIQQTYLDSGEPIVSIDTKKKELLGTFYRNGRVYTREGLLAWDHDFPAWAHGRIIPYGIYDLGRNFGYLSVGTSHDTSEFACDSIAWWWTEHGHRLYPQARSICLLGDGGGSNSSRQYLFKEDLQKLSDRLELPIRVAHYPPYCSKYNPIERRLFPHVTRACQGVLFDSLATVVRLLEKTRTATGLGVVVQVLDKIYQMGRKYAAGFKETMRIRFDDFLPQWNYCAVPTVS
jgi:hypothetical protein